MTATVEEYSDILYEVKDAVARVTINRPDKLNAFTPHTVKELAHAIWRAGADSQAGVIVLTGAGERAFSAGGDVSVENEDTFRAGDDSFDKLMKELYRAFRECLKPVIARVDGYAIGGGHHMAYVTDFTIASDRSVFGQNGPRVASPAEGWLVSHLWTVVGMKRAKEIWMLCRRYTAQQALDWGLVNAVVPADELDAEVERWCAELLALSPTVLKLIKKSFDDSTAHIREEQERFTILNQVNPGFFASGEQTEGSQAFMDKRKPDFSPWR
ncbi:MULTISPECIES: enoyl-CoA hydratase-related protein [Pseudonocardia]|uniref:Enoyl-CoA hydratase/isomerase family protein n=1 Tax=Pseudonocardia abyssalis TaxID=2792008 RepID=A0ABS6V1G9_9PSEU|nr:enoyl-CoA hydratase-related protein [Pseudonocardia abyssalis]MBW0113674.1 enoyl-CoA hydratase/isomerase family protein [Pseudonocardia abyssalis]MBW0138355.1 enoyl-CoA hydratase/isomerase family protein [Pseudonocardia abyssalis]